jgi:hypothetical protein
MASSLEESSTRQASRCLRSSWFPSGRPEEWTTKAVRLGGVEFGQRDIDFRAGEDISGLEVELDKPLRR